MKLLLLLVMGVALLVIACGPGDKRGDNSAAGQPKIQTYGAEIERYGAEDEQRPAELRLQTEHAGKRLDAYGAAADANKPDVSGREEEEPWLP